MELTPAMKQYMDIKREHKEAILFFRMGDFYEMFFEDAIVASRILDIALTSRDRDSGIPMCGVPHHARDSYIVKLLKSGHNVAICEQHDEQERGGIFRREVVEVLTPGLIPRDDFLESGKGNFLVAINLSRGFSISAADISTGELYFEVISRPEKIIDATQKIDVAEIIYDEETASKLKYSGYGRKLPPGVTKREVAFKDYAESETLCEKFFNEDLSEDMGFLLLLDYIRRNQPDAIQNLSAPRPFQGGKGLHLDESALVSLEVLRSFQGGKRGSLLGVLDRTKTPMGKRLIKKYLAFPLADLKEINRRLESTEELVVHGEIRKGVSALLEGMCDLERIGIKIVAEKATPRDLVALSRSLGRVAEVKEILGGCISEGLRGRGETLHPLSDMRASIDHTIVDDPPATLRDGGVIRDGCDDRIDMLRQVKSGGVHFLRDLEEKERARTNIPSLKVKYNKVFGYFIEVSKTYVKNVPPEYTRKQTLVNAERYIIPELKDFESTQTSAIEELKKLEEERYRQFLTFLTKWGKDIMRNAHMLSEVDVLSSFAEVAQVNGYVKPDVHKGSYIRITEGRHPVVEKMIGRKEFVANDTFLDQTGHQIGIITGPNMAGKSTYIRQVALMVLMAHAGSFVPAAHAEIGVTDSIFTRIGATDNIHLGESTFMVEMKEVSKILRELTDRSLIILDEIGRGTSTYDGLSIAWAVMEYIHSLDDKRPITLFATHYHEVCELGNMLPRANNYNVLVKEWKEQVLFLRKIERGSSNKSYGIYVGEIAGLPGEVTVRAKEILKSLENSEYNGSKKGRLLGEEGGRSVQPSLFSSSRELEYIGDFLDTVNTDNITPIEALNILEEIKKRWLNLKKKE